MARTAHPDAERPAPSVSPDASPAADVPSRAYLALAYIVLVLLGAVLGVLGAFLTPAGPRVGGFLLSLGVGLALVGNLVAGTLGLRAVGSRLGAGAPLIAWLVVVLPFGSVTPAGGVVLSGTPRSIVFLLVGALAGTVPATLGRPSRGMTALASRR